MAFLLIDRSDLWHGSGFGAAHSIRRPILENVIGGRLHRVPRNGGGRIWLRRPLPREQIHHDKQTKKSYADQGQVIEILLSRHCSFSFRKDDPGRTYAQGRLFIIVLSTCSILARSKTAYSLRCSITALVFGFLVFYGGVLNLKNHPSHR